MFVAILEDRDLRASSKAKLWAWTLKPNIILCFGADANLGQF